MDTSTPAAPPEPGDAGAEPTTRRRRIAIIAGSAIAIAAVVALLVVGLLNQNVPTTIQDALAEGDRPDAPEIGLPLLTGADGLGGPGDTITLDDLRGKVVILNFWASWCEPCRTEAPILEGVARGYRQRGEDVVVLGNDIEDVPNSARAFLEEHDISYATVRDGSGDSQRRWETTGVPETFIIDREGRVAAKYTGELTAPEQLTVVVEQLLKEDAAS